MVNKMTEPSVDELLKKVDSQYTLVIMASRRARAINDEQVTSQKKTRKPVTVALEEILHDKVTYQRKDAEDVPGV